MVWKLKTLFCCTVRLTGPTQVIELATPKSPSEELRLTATLYWPDAEDMVNRRPRCDVGHRRRTGGERIRVPAAAAQLGAVVIGETNLHQVSVNTRTSTNEME